MRKTALPLVLAAACLAGLPAGGGDGEARAMLTPESFSGIYDLYVGGIFGGEMSVEARLHDGAYKANAAGQTAGIVGTFWDAGFAAVSEGRRTDGAYRPARFVVDSYGSGDKQFVEMLYGPDGAPREVEAKPPFKKRPWQVDPTKQSGAFDPLSAVLSGLALLPREKICNQSVEVFDGRKRYAVDLAEPVEEAGKIRCKGEYRRIAGFKPKQLAKPNWPMTLWFEPDKAGLWHVATVQGGTPIGTASVTLRKG